MYSAQYYIRKVKDIYYDTKRFFINIVKYRKVLIDSVEFSGDLGIETYFYVHLNQLLKYYSNPKNCIQVDESRLEIVKQLEYAIEMLDIIIGEKYFDTEEMTDEEIEIAYDIEQLIRKDFFNYINNHYQEWWD